MKLGATIRFHLFGLVFAFQPCVLATSFTALLLPTSGGHKSLATVRADVGTLNVRKVQLFAPFNIIGGKREPFSSYSVGLKMRVQEFFHEKWARGWNAQYNLAFERQQCSDFVNAISAHRGGTGAYFGPWGTNPMQQINTGARRIAVLHNASL